MQILIIDDDEIVLMLHGRLVTKFGLCDSPIKFNNASGALNYLMNNNSNDYLLMLDINMPGMNGWEFLELLSATPLNDRILVAMISSSINNLDKEKAKTYPQVITFIEKPLRTEDMPLLNQLYLKSSKL